MQIPDTITEIGQNVFSDCQNLTDVVLTENSTLVTIRAGAFKDTSIKKFSMPKTVRTLE